MGIKKLPRFSDGKKDTLDYIRFAHSARYDTAHNCFVFLSFRSGSI